MTQGRRNRLGTRNGRIAASAAWIAFAVSLVLWPAQPLLAQAEITYISVNGFWHDPVDNLPGSQPGDPVITNGSPTSSISWGDTTGSQSGYDFTTTLPPPFTLPGPIPFFSLGSFTHRNFEVDDPSLTSVELDVVLELAVDGVPTGPLTFTFTFNHEETPNNQTPCPYPTPPGEGCTDRVTIVASAAPTTFNVDGVDYTLEMSFLDDGNPVSEFITREGGTVNSSGLVGEFTLPPGLTVAKSGPASMRLAEWGDFVIDVRNGSDADAYNVTLLDRLPDGPTGGMCAAPPEILSARVFEADGVTTVPGKGPLVEGTDYSLVWDGAACELSLRTLTAAAVVGVDERLLIAYRTELDTDSEDGATLTNVAGAIEWFSDAETNPARVRYARTLTDGTEALVDHEDAHSVTVALPVLRFEKTVLNVTTGEDPAATATPGDTLRYRLYVENLSDVAVTDFRIVDELDSLNAPPGFAAGTLNLITAPPGADTTGTDAMGGAAGTGLVDVGNLDIGGLGATVLVEYEVALAPVIADGRFIYNQAELSTGPIAIAVSDDPNVNGEADPGVTGDEDPTRVLIESAPYFDVDKVSSYITGSPTVLLAGETLRYTITVRNVGTDDAVDTVLRDEVPASTAYVAGSTRLNGVPVPDAAGGQSPLSAGIPINAPGDPTPGAMRADTAATADNVATIVFDVVVDPDAADGTVISNQGFVSAPGGGVVDRPSDDPRTPLVDDPTRDVVGNLPLIYAEKSAALEVDLSTPNVVDPGDVLRYTITIYNNGTVPATEVALMDEVPLYTTYVADSTTLNGLAVGQPDGGVSPLAAGIPVSSGDLTPPLPLADAGTLTGGQSAVVEFLLRVEDATARGSLIVNQAEVTSYEAPAVLTDGDGNPATGPEPTVVVVGDAQQLTITKAVAVVGGGPALAGATLEYTVRVQNVSLVPASYVEITDDLDMPVAGQLTYVAGSATMNGLTDGITFVGSTLTADYDDVYGNLAPGAEILLRFQAEIYPDLPMGTRITNTAEVKWDDPPRYAEASVSIDVGGMVGSGILSGGVWHDPDFDDQRDPGERLLEGWLVELYRAGERVRFATTDVDGNYRIAGVAPTYMADDRYELRFSAPGAGPATAALGRAFSQDFVNGMQLISDIAVPSGANLLNLDLPIDPNGVVYNAASRAPLASAVLTMLAAGSGAPLPPACFDDPVQQGQVTLGEGFYKFDMNFSDPACPEGGDYLIGVAPPSAAFLPGESEIIPPQSGSVTGPFSVPGCLQGGAGDAIPSSTHFCEATASELAPTAAVPPGAAGTFYYLRLTLDNSDNPGSRQIFNNHIPLDLDLADSVTISKTSPALSVRRGELVPYIITLTNDIGFDLSAVSVVDRFPAGFRYVEGSARLDGVAMEPAVAGRELVWGDLALIGAGQHRIDLLLAVGSGVSEGDFVNRAQVMHGITGDAMSAEASATVRLVPDADLDCTDVIGKVFDDANGNEVQDPGEAGIGGVRLVTATGLAATTDAYGRYHITCAAVPNESRGSNFVLKLDDRTLPTGFRASSDLVQIERATRGKTLRFNFGVAIDRVVGLDVSDPIFEPGLTGLRPQWQSRLGLVLEQLEAAPAVLRLSYLADLEDPALVQERIDALEREIRGRWEGAGGYELVIEPEILWRLGAPAERPDAPTGRRDEGGADAGGAR